MIVLSRKNGLLPGANEDSPNRTHSFDAGATWGYLALQARETPSPRLPLAQMIYEGAYQAD